MDYWKDSCREGPGMTLLRPGLGGQGPHLEEAHIFWHADYPRLGSGSACWDQSFLSGRLAVTILHDLDSQASSIVAQGAILNGGRCDGPYPQARVWLSVS